MKKVFIEPVVELTKFEYEQLMVSEPTLSPDLEIPEIEGGEDM